MATKMVLTNDVLVSLLGNAELTSTFPFLAALKAKGDSYRAPAAGKAGCPKCDGDPRFSGPDLLAAKAAIAKLGADDRATFKRIVGAASVEVVYRERMRNKVAVL